MAAATNFAMIAMIFVVLAAVVSAQISPVSAPAGMDTGSGYSIPVSGLILCVSMIVSMMTINY